MYYSSIDGCRRRRAVAGPNRPHTRARLARRSTAAVLARTVERRETNVMRDVGVAASASTSRASSIARGSRKPEASRCRRHDFPVRALRVRARAAANARHEYPQDFLDLGPRIRTVSLDDDDFDSSTFDFVCDVRSGGEYDDDHVPGAISTPVLNDEQRKRVGTLYKQVDPFEAKKVGAALVAANLSDIIEERFMACERSTKILVYCWRGGERSLSLAHVLSRIGFDVYFAPGGYKRYRAGVLEWLRGMDAFVPRRRGQDGVRQG